MPLFFVWFRKTILLFLVFIAGAVALWFWGSLKFVYSHGDRAGYIQKFSQKGWLIKTWEGEMAMVTLPGAIPEKFMFTVRNLTAVEKIKAVIGQRVVLEYDEHKALPGTLFGDTPYFVTNVRAAEDLPFSPQSIFKEEK
jgi:hypothetical protein